MTEIIHLLSGKTLSDNGSGFNGAGLDRWLFEENLSGSNPFFGNRFFLKVPIVGIGAPVKAFLPQVALALGTEVIFPPDFEVANAVGAAVGHVVIRREGQIYPCVEGATVNGYYARVTNRQEKFQSYPEALAYAKESLTRDIQEESQMAGGNHAKVEIEINPILDGMAYLHAWSIS